MNFLPGIKQADRGQFFHRRGLEQSALSLFFYPCAFNRLLTRKFLYGRRNSLFLLFDMNVQDLLSRFQSRFGCKCLLALF